MDDLAWLILVGLGWYLGDLVGYARGYKDGTKDAEFFANRSNP